MFMSRFTPNSFIDVYRQIPVDTGDAMPNAPGLFCVSENPDLRCFACGSDRQSFGGARSKHPGGVNVTKGDGSATFVSNNVDITLWLAAGSIAGNEPVQEF